MSTTRQETSGSTGLFMSQGRYLYSAMSTMSSYDLLMMQQWLEQMKQYAEAYGGFKDTENAEGQEVVTLETFTDCNGNTQYGGLVGHFLDESFSAAKSAGAAINFDADSAIVAAVSSGIGLVGMGAGAFATRDGALGDQENDLKAFQDGLDSPAQIDAVMQEAPESEGLEMQNIGDPPAAQQNEVDEESDPEVNRRKQAVENRIKEWKEIGGKAGFNYTKQYSNISADDEEINQVAIQKVKGDPDALDAIKKNIAEKRENIERVRQSNNSRFQGYSTTSQAVQSFGTSVGSATFGFDKATEQTAQIVSQSEADVLKQLQQTMTGNVSMAQQKGDQFAQDAQAVASGYGQIVNTHA